jgi:hypothetical protein
MYVFLTKAQSDDLRKKGLSLSMESFERDDSEKGFLAAKEDLSAFLDGEEIPYELKEQIFEGIENIKIGTVSAGGAKVVKTKSAATSTASTGHIEVEAPEATWDGKGREKFVEVVREELKGVFGKVFVSVPNGEVEPPTDADYELNIKIWSSPNEKYLRGDGKDLRPPEKLFGETVACRDASFAPTKKTTKTFEENGYVWGEYLRPNYLYIFFDVCQKDTVASLAIFREMLKQFVKEVGKEPLKDATKEIAKKREEKQRNELRGFMKKMLESQFASSKQKIEQLTKDIESMHCKLVQMIRDKDYHMKLFKAFDESEVDKKIALMVRDLYQDKNINGLKVEGGLFKVFTDVLYVTDPRTGWKHEVGKFRIDLDCAQGLIRIYNLTRQVVAYSGQRMQAPHVFQNNQMCPGNFVETTAELFGKHDYSNLASTVIIFLQSVNTDDAAGRCVHHWPKVNDDGSTTDWDKLSDKDKEFLAKKGLDHA